ncbi:MAG: efflux RND transporter periplasmic adaptor subunit [Gammaproteobacteria bacterium]|nr:efflux RND transporter periplasmic adaptor subunit [Gammaproteobacteria bacterium]MDH3429416.1 efflux RND transporter periplasmic adaptor subunit [Gammaproteobacteria bacterium]MDH3432709.1 efflux RND transporter periplasmic adaptor subunit [Gammaproteobacteria bacterium]
MRTSKPINTAVAVISLAALSGCGIGQASNTEEVPATTPVPVEVTLPVRGDIYATYHATTTIISDAEAPVLARVPGEVVRLLVEEGAAVRQGQVLAVLDGERLRLEMLAAKAKLEQVRKEFARYSDLAERGLVSVSMFEGLKYDVDALQATYDLAKLNYDYSSIRAPIDGVVSARNIKLGQNIEANSVAFQITDTTRLIAYLQIPQAELAKFSPGHNASLQVDSMPDTDFDATIARISPTIDVRNGTFRATAFVDNSNGHLVPGMFARFTIAYEKHEGALMVPGAAVVEEDDEMTVYVVTSGAVARRIVTIGVEADGQVEILSGLAEDDQIVIVGHSGLRDGSRVLASIQSLDSYSG